VPKPQHVPDHRRSPANEGKQRDFSSSGASVETVVPRKRRKFTASEKQRLLKDAAAVASGVDASQVPRRSDEVPRSRSIHLVIAVAAVTT